MFDCRWPGWHLSSKFFKFFQCILGKLLIKLSDSLFFPGEIASYFPIVAKSNMMVKHGAKTQINLFQSEGF